MDVEKEIVGVILKWLFPKGERSKTYLEKQRKRILKQVRDPNNYLSYNITNGRIEKLVFALFSDAPFELDRIQVVCSYFDDHLLTKKSLKEELRRLREFFKPKKLKIVIGLPPKKTKLLKTLKSLDFESNGIKLKGSVHKSLVSLRKLDIPTLAEEFSYELMNYKNNIKAVMNLEYQAHRSEESSVVYKMPKKHWAFFEDYLKDIARKKLAYVLKYNNKIIGFISYDINSDLPHGAFVVSISLAPKFKGRGIAKFLYLRMLEDLKRRKIKTFYGYSKTKQVLRFSKKIERVPSYYSFKLSKELVLKL
jgi:L-amino acid N-acyltransferase YncA